MKFLYMRKMMEIFLNLEILVDYGDEIKSKYLLLTLGADGMAVFEKDKGILEKCREYQYCCNKTLNNVRIIPQMHKELGIR